MHKHKWTEEEREIVRRDYDGHNKTSEIIAQKLTLVAGDRITLYAVKGQAACMGIMQNKSPDWTEKEINILRDMINEYAPLTIARKLGRSVNAVVVKSKRLGLKRRYRNGWYTKKEVTEICGVDHKKVQRWIDEGWLKASWHTGNKPQKSGMSPWHIEEKDLRDFIIQHGAGLQGRNVNLFQIIALLVEC
ncbi:MAG: helix-turn-helix domain-containing protein [bacterium]